MSSDECTSSCSSSPPTPPSPLPISVGPGRRRYTLSPSPSPSPPFSPPSQPSSPETTPLLYRTQSGPQSPPPAALHLEALFWQQEEAPSSPPSWSLKDCLAWVLTRCCCVCCPSLLRREDSPWRHPGAVELNERAIGGHSPSGKSA